MNRIIQFSHITCTCLGYFCNKNQECHKRCPSDYSLLYCSAVIWGCLWSDQKKKEKRNNTKNAEDNNNHQTYQKVSGAQIKVRFSFGTLWTYRN